MAGLQIRCHAVRPARPGSTCLTAESRIVARPAAPPACGTYSPASPLKSVVNDKPAPWLAAIAAVRAPFSRPCPATEVREKKSIKEALGRGQGLLPLNKSSVELGTENQIWLIGTSVTGVYLAFAPVIDQFLKGHLFGDILGREVLDFCTSEIATIAALANLEGVNPQLQAHFKIGLNTGLTEAQMRSLIAVLATKIGQPQADNAAALLSKVLKREPAPPAQTMVRLARLENSSRASGKLPGGAAGGNRSVAAERAGRSCVAGRRREGKPRAHHDHGNLRQRGCLPGAHRVTPFPEIQGRHGAHGEVARASGGGPDFARRKSALRNASGRQEPGLKRRARSGGRTR